MTKAALAVVPAHDAGVTEIDAHTGDVAVMPVVNEETLALAGALGFDGDLTIPALEDGIRFYQRRTVESLLELGKRLLLLREMTPRGGSSDSERNKFSQIGKTFDERLEELGLSKSSAYRFMNAAAKTARSGKLPLLATQVKSVSAFLELVTHDDDVLDEMAEMDDLDRMSASQVRDVARQLQAQVQGKVSAEQKLVNRLERELEIKDETIRQLQTVASVNTAYTTETNIVRQQAALLDATAAQALVMLEKLEVGIDPRALHDMQYEAQIHSVWFAAVAIATRAKMLVDRLHEQHGSDLPPPMAASNFAEGINTPEEAVQFLRDVDDMRSGLAADVERVRTNAEEAAPRGRGRPKGSKNTTAKSTQNR